MSREEFRGDMLSRKWKLSKKGTFNINESGYNVLYMPDSNDNRVWTWRIAPNGHHDQSREEWAATKYSSALDAQRAAVERLADILGLN